jgi:hypothetical protein
MGVNPHYAVFATYSDFIALVGGVAAPWPLAAYAQQEAKLPKSHSTASSYSRSIPLSPYYSVTGVRRQTPVTHTGCGMGFGNRIDLFELG